MKLLFVIFCFLFYSCGKTQSTLPINAGGTSVSINEPGGASTVSINQVLPFQNLTRNIKPLLKIAVVGNSLVGNFLGGDIPIEYDEGNTSRPIRLTVDNIPRRLYDLWSWNKATHVRLDNAAWVWADTWSTTTTMFEPSYANEVYHQTSIAGNYAEVTIPDGQENFAFICQKNTSLASIDITLNGGSIAAYGPSSVVCARTAAPGEVNGNPYFVVEYNNLPAGTNIIRLTKSTSGTVRIWGGFYWTGNTVIVHNLGHGGHTMGELLTEHLAAEVGDNDYDGILFELTEMNEQSTTQDPVVSQADFQEIIDTYFGDRDVCVMSCNPMGTDPVGGTPNFYTLYDNPITQEQLNALLISQTISNVLPYIDVFSFFKSLIIAGGGTLVGGDGGQYTLDGQHPSIPGEDIWWDYMLPTLSNNRIVNP